MHARSAPPRECPPWRALFLLRRLWARLVPALLLVHPAHVLQVACPGDLYDDQRGEDRRERNRVLLQQPHDQGDEREVPGSSVGTPSYAAPPRQIAQAGSSSRRAMRSARRRARPRPLSRTPLGTSRLGSSQGRRETRRAGRCPRGASSAGRRARPTSTRRTSGST